MRSQRVAQAAAIKAEKPCARMVKAAVYRAADQLSPFKNTIIQAMPKLKIVNRSKAKSKNPVSLPLGETPVIAQSPAVSTRLPSMVNSMVDT